jgi:hypothetical protein
VQPGGTIAWQVNLFSRNAQNEPSPNFAPHYPYGLNIFQLSPTLITDYGEVRLPEVAAHLHGFGMLSEYSFRMSPEDNSRRFDKVSEVLTLIKNKTLVADPKLQVELSEGLESHQARSNRT